MEKHPNDAFVTEQYAYVLLLFAYWALIAVDLWWGQRGLGRAWTYYPPVIYEPLPPKALLALLFAAVVCLRAFFRGLLTYSRLQRIQLRFVSAAIFSNLVQLVIAAFDLQINRTLDLFFLYPLRDYAFALFYSPLLGLVRLLPGLETRVITSFYLPSVSFPVALVYAAATYGCYKLGGKVRERALKDAEGAQPGPDAALEGPASAGQDAPLRPEKPRDRLFRQLFALLCVLSALFFVLWTAERQDNSRYALLVRSTAAALRVSIEACGSDGGERDYRRVVADFRAFERAYARYSERVGRQGSAALCGEIYEALLNDPARARPLLGRIAYNLSVWENSLGYDADPEQMAELHKIFAQ
ncbi:MAG TPA: hypothetical protein VN446_00535 [Candidatus Acidoferrum sp.]|nr:hypothetical protein [Candidatus Acidoferrum sp.]